MRWRSALTLIIVAGLVGGAYMRLIRPWYKNWGATPEEASRPMPLDDRVPDPIIAATRAVTVDASADKVWPWLV